MRRLLKKLLQVLAVVAAVGALALGLFFASLWFENSQSLELPRRWPRRHHLGGYGPCVSVRAAAGPRPRARRLDLVSGAAL